MTDEDFMNLALKEAQKAFSQDEVPIGAVLVEPESGQIVAKAHNKSEHGSDATAHAETLIIRKACQKLKTKPM